MLFLSLKTFSLVSGVVRLLARLIAIPGAFAPTAHFKISVNLATVRALTQLYKLVRANIDAWSCLVEMFQVTFCRVCMFEPNHIAAQTIDQLFKGREDSIELCEFAQYIT